MSNRGRRSLGGGVALALVLVFLAYVLTAKDEDMVSTELLVSTELDELPGILRTSADGPPISKVTSGSIDPVATEEIDALIAEWSKGYDPAECWIFVEGGRHAAYAAGDSPVEYADVWAKTENDELILEQIFRYDSTDGPQRVLDHMSAALGQCSEFLIPGYDIPFRSAVADRTSELGLSGTIAYSGSRGAWTVVSIHGDLIMFLSLPNEAAVDPIALATKAVAKIRQGS